MPETITVNPLTVATHDLELYQGEDFTAVYRLKGSDGNAIDLTGYTVEAILVRHFTKVVAIFSGSVTNAIAGEIEISLAGRQVLMLSPASYSWVLTLISAVGRRDQIVKGSVSVYGGQINNAASVQIPYGLDALPQLSADDLDLDDLLYVLRSAGTGSDRNAAVTVNTLALIFGEGAIDQALIDFRGEANPLPQYVLIADLQTALDSKANAPITTSAITDFAEAVDNRIAILAGGTARIAFAFGDASPKPIALIPVGKAIFTVQLIITTPFNGTGAALMIGDAAQSDRLMASSRNSPVFVAEYETNPGWVATQDTEILLTITPGAGCTQGSGFILLFFS